MEQDRVVSGVLGKQFFFFNVVLEVIINRMNFKWKDGDKFIDCGIVGLEKLWILFGDCEGKEEMFL